MKKKTAFIIITTLLFLLGISLLIKHIQLRNVVFDGDGIGIYFFPFVHNERVPNEQVASYAQRFLTASIISLMGALFCLFVSFQKRLTR